MTLFPIADIFPNTYGGINAAIKSSVQNQQAERAQSKENPSTGESKQSTDDESTNQQEQRKIEQLKARDREVRAHEQAHKSAGGSLTGPANFEYEQGPDGKRYAVSGEVSIDTSPVHGDPHATLLKANRIRSAALAPANPSPQDLSVAADASKMANDARIEIREAKIEEAQTNEETNPAQTETTQSSLAEESPAGDKEIDKRLTHATINNYTNEFNTASKKGSLVDVMI